MSRAWKSAESSRTKRAKALPTGVGFCVFMPRDLLASAAWQVMSRQCRLLVDALMIEHAEHGGVENGNLKAPYDTLLNLRGMRHADIKKAIHEAVALGIISAKLGQRSYGARRLPSLFRLTWLGTPDGLMPTHEWKAIESDNDAKIRLEKAMQKLQHERLVNAATRKERAARRRPQASSEATA
jgi:hypothetical protein